MGIRPEMHIVFGVDDFGGSLDYDVVSHCDLSVPDDIIYRNPFREGYIADAFRDYNTKEWNPPQYHLYYGGFYDGHNTVIGMKINRTYYDSNLIRALSIFHSRYEISGKTDIPVWSPEKHPYYAERVKNGHYHTDDITFRWSWFYPSVLEQHSMWTVHAYNTRHLLSRIGVTIDPARYKAMLVWDWI